MNISNGYSRLEIYRLDVIIYTLRNTQYQNIHTFYSLKNVIYKWPKRMEGLHEHSFTSSMPFQELHKLTGI